MPPRCSAHVADARSTRIAAAAGHAAPAFAPLPHALVLHILSLLPVDTRLRCAEVCRSWRAALEERSLWLRLYLSARSGISPECVVTSALLRAATTRARGQVQALHVDVRHSEFLDFDALLAVVKANGGTLRELRVRSIWGRHACDSDDSDHPLPTDELLELLHAAPSLAVCEADVQCSDFTIAGRLLRNEPPFAALRVHTFQFSGEVWPDWSDPRPEDPAVLALAADTASHTHLRRLLLDNVGLNTAAALDAVVDAALARQLTSVGLRECNLSPESVPALERLIGGCALLAELDIAGENHTLLDVPAALALGNALRACSTLTALSVRHADLWHDPAVAMALLGALTGHPSLRSLNVSYNPVDPMRREEAGAALDALVAANAPVLQELRLFECWL